MDIKLQQNKISVQNSILQKNNSNSSSGQSYIISDLKTSNQQALNSGGTADILPNERKKATFDVQDMILFLDGGKEANKRKNLIRSPLKNVDQSVIYTMNRPQLLAHQVKEFIRIHKVFPNFQASRQDIAYMSEAASYSGSSLLNHMMLFLTTIAGQASEEQQKWWLRKTINFEIIGCYAQTELGHGSNVRGLETTATYSKSTQEFILNTPTLTARKWWPGTLAKIATHAVVYAQLIIDGKEYGVHSFMVQIRDENHKPLQGIELGDLGAKVGDNANDTGYMVLKNVRIPRVYMLSRFTSVNSDGQYISEKLNKQVHYTTMLTTRATLVNIQGSKLAASACIATRYSCVRQQGFQDPSPNVAFRSDENKIIDYKIQQYRIFKQISNAFALKFAGKLLIDSLKEIEGKQIGQITNQKSLNNLAALSSGLKSLGSQISTEGIEELRKCTGGNGYLLHSGISMLGMTHLWHITAEGDMVVMALNTARLVVKAAQNVIKGKPQVGFLDYLNVLKNNQLFDKTKLTFHISNDINQYQNLDYLCQLFSHKAILRIIDVTKELAINQKNKQLSFDASWNMSALKLQKAANAHCFYLLLRNFLNYLNTAKNEKIKTVLHQVCNLFAIANILDSDWQDILSHEQYEIARTLQEKLLASIRPNCIALVDSFDIPDYILNSSIGNYDGNVYESLFNSARKSQLNQVDPFKGYTEHLRPHLDLEFLKLKNQHLPKL